MGPLSRDEKVVAVAFVLMVTGWVSAGTLKLDLTAVAFAGLGTLLATSVLTLDDIKKEGGTLETYLWLAVLFAMSGQLNELGFMSYVGGRLSAALAGVSWPAAYVALLVLYVLMHYLFVSQSSQVLALFGVFVDVGVRAGVSTPLMALRVAVRQQLLLDDHAARRQPERDLRRQRLHDGKASCTSSGRSPHSSACSSSCCWARRGFSWSSAEGARDGISSSRPCESIKS